MPRMGLSLLREAHALPRAAEAMVCWTGVLDPLLGSSMDRRVRCRQTDRSLQHGC